MIIQATNFIEESEIEQYLEELGIEFQYLTPKNTVSTFFVTGVKPKIKNPEQFVLNSSNAIRCFDSGWKKELETTSMRDAIEKTPDDVKASFSYELKMSDPNYIKTDNSQVIANLQEQLKDIEHYVSGGWKNDLEPSDQKVKKGFEMAMNEIARQFFISGEVMDIASKYEITPELIDELKKFIK